MHLEYNRLKLALLLVAGSMIIVTMACEPTPTPVPITTSRTPTATVPSPTQTPARTIKVLRFGRVIYPDVLDPQKSAAGNEIEALKLCYEGLAALDAQGNIVPGSADKWDLAKDGKSVTFHIREDLKRADGVSMNASDFEYALRREVDPRVTDKQYYDLVRDIKGADALVDLEGKKSFRR